jgi:cyclase
MKKRLIFTLLYERGSFVLSRNFRTQKIGDIRWLNSNYNFAKVAQHIDELVLINVSRDKAFDKHFRETLSELLSGVFVPVTAGGGVTALDDAQTLFSSGADKILLNHALHHDAELVASLSRKYGQQAVVGSLDVRHQQGNLEVFSNKATTLEPLTSFSRLVEEGHVGEVYLNSIDQDGTGQGMDLGILTIMGRLSPIPVILAGGAGKPAHLADAIASPLVNAVATANLLNFVGDGLRKTRDAILSAGIDLASWD